jgi:hypothetical protein
MAPRPIRVLGLGCMVLAQGGSLASTLAHTPQYSRQKCMPLRHAKSRIYRNYRNIYILSDSQATIKALDCYHFNSKLVWDCHQSLVQLAKNKRVQLIWVSGHEGTVGNEIVDHMVKLGSECPYIGPKPAFSNSV